MEDESIISLYFERNEWAISESHTKYGKYCHSIAYNILYSSEDSEECVNDTFFKAWNVIPPEKPKVLSAFFGRITRNLALDRYRAARAEKRKGAVEDIFDEALELIPSGETDPSDDIAVRDALNGFLATLTKNVRVMFVQRYWYMMPIKDIAKLSGMKEGSVKVTLLRTREKLKEYLEREGITV